MIIPVFAAEAVSAAAPVGEWATLTPEEKHERLLSAAATVFTTHDLEAPMSEVAAAAGSGMGAVYRRFPSKRELLAALVIRRMETIASTAREAEAISGSRLEALRSMVRSLVERQKVDDFLGEARARVADHPEVQVATERATAALERVLDAARLEGTVRSDATTLDLRLLFAATRAAKRVEPDQWPRMLELMLDALETRRP